MSNEVQRYQAPANPFARSQHAEHVNAGTIAIEAERAIAEAQGKLVIAKRFQRDPFAAFNRVMDACKRKGLAEEAIYSYPRGGQTVSGPSIRLAEELARCWGNIDYGYRELSQRDGVSEMEAYAWDLETNTVSSQKFTVRHVRDKQDGGKVLTEQRDIYEQTANMASRRMRARILAILPGDLVDAAVAECRKTLAGSNERPMADKVRDLLLAFGKQGITQAHVEQRLGKAVAEMLPEEYADLLGVGRSIRDGMSKPGDWFAGMSHANDNKPADTPAAQRINDGARKRQSRQAEEGIKPQEAPAASTATTPATQQPATAGADNTNAQSGGDNGEMF